MTNFLSTRPLVISALHLPDLGAPRKPISMAWLEDYVLQNMAIFMKGGLTAVFLQDETLNAGPARPETIAIMSSLGRLARREYPALQLGIIFQAHDPIAPIAVAYATGASFVRIKVFVGAMLKAEGVHEGCGIAARDFRHRLNGEDIAILADVHDRTGFPTIDVPIPVASRWAVHAGADALVLTGRTYAESLQFLQTVRDSGVTRPLLMGGSATEDNVREILQYADGVIVSTALKRKDSPPDDIIQWDIDAISRFMDAARSVSKR